MNNLQTMNKETLTSLEVLEQINFFREKEGNKKELLHKSLLEIIRNEFEEEIGGQKILLGSYKDKQNQERPMFELNLSQAKQILVRESKFVRKAVIKYIETLESKLNNRLPGTYKEALLELVSTIEENETLQLENKVKDQQIAELKPKATYYDLILQCKDLLSVTEIAKDYGMSAKSLNKLLHELKIQFNQGGVWFLYQKYASFGYTQTKTQNYSKSNGEIGARPHMYWTQKGRLFLYSLLKENGHLPTIEKENMAIYEMIMPNMLSEVR